MILLACFVLAHTAARAQKPATDDAADVRHFVQSFYDWFFPMQEHDEGGAHLDVQQLTFTSKAELFDPSLDHAMLEAIRVNKKEDERELQRLTIGEATDPFLGWDLGIRNCVAGPPKQKGDLWFVPVRDPSGRSATGLPSVTAVVQKMPAKAGWRFVNFIYDKAGWNLKDYIRLAHGSQKGSFATGELTPDQIQWIRAEKLRIAVPTYIPPGMHLTKFALDAVSPDEAGAVELSYRGAGKAEFVVEMISDGLGDLVMTSDNGDIHDPTSNPTISNPNFGDVEMGFLHLPGENHFGSQWITLRDKDPIFACAIGHHIRYADSVKIVEGLRLVK